MPNRQEMTDAEVEAAIDEAHLLERHVAAHISGGPSITMAGDPRSDIRLLQDLDRLRVWRAGRATVA